VSGITDAASVLLARSPGSSEVFLVRRADNLRFFGGYIAFPGGKVNPEDAGLANFTPGLTARHVAAIRELFEETGVLIARTADGSFLPASPTLNDARHELNAGRVAFDDLLRRLGLTLSPDDVHSAGTLTTPPFTAMRFATGFFTATLPPGQVVDVWPGELAGGHWASADAALTAWTAGENLLSPPTVSLLELIRGRPVADLPEHMAPLLDILASDVIPTIWSNPGVRMLPLFSRGLPPSTHTNAFLVGTDSPYLIDPGPPDADEQQRLFGALDDALSDRRLAGIILTHHHPDHIGAAATCSERYRAPILAHEQAARLLSGKVHVDRQLRDGDQIDLGPAPDGVGRWHLEAVFTPGHAPDHLVFWEPRYRLLFAGDMVSTLSSIIIAPPQGDLAVYLDSLRRLRGLPARLLLPAHGSPSARPAHVLDESIAHRVRREAQLIELLSGGPRRMGELVAEIYRGLPDGSLKLGELQLLAGLEKLRREGRVQQTGEAWAMCLTERS
jgi:glyoxylase-like metal-dependent hydrolase (beta-lactamase superfamily II)/8-oxo-dGTP pyrophosphatase MutT (NUDIX family)